MKDNKHITSGANFWQKTSYYLTYYTLKAIGLLPEWFLYHPLVELLYLLLYRVVHYRIDLVRENLRNSFPEKSDAELRDIERKFYRNLAEVFVDTIDLTSISTKRLRKRMVFVDEECHRNEAIAGRDWIAAISHYGSWEYFISYSANDEPGRETMGIYRPLHNVVMDMVYRSIRSRMRMSPVPMAVTLRHIIRNRRDNVRMCVGLIADQAPPWFHRDYWYDFLHQPTAFFDGLETIATRFNMPVYFTRIEKVKRAHYKVYFEKIYDGDEQLPPHEITKRYAAKLEDMIHQRPELWLWSHRRWKHKPTEEELAKQYASECL